MSSWSWALCPLHMALGCDWVTSDMWGSKVYFTGIAGEDKKIYPTGTGRRKGRHLCGRLGISLVGSQ